MDSLFNQTPQTLATRRRPTDWKDFVGQEHFWNARFQSYLGQDRWVGLVFWGPPGSGKTTLARLIAEKSRRPFVSLSAVSAGVKEIREALERSRKDVAAGYPAHALFLDEFHHLNRSQQDILLPDLEEGYIRLIGATTENPSFELNAAILSRCLIFRFLPLPKEALAKLLERAAPQYPLPLIRWIAEAAGGDGRRALNLLEYAVNSQITEETELKKLLESQSQYYDKKLDQHYDTISAFIKSVRGSDAQAAVYYLARMIEGGENPLFIARRLIILASEDIGDANPMALLVAEATARAVDQIGMPEGRIPLAQAAIYLAQSPKSNRCYVAINRAQEEVKRRPNLEIPLSIRNAPTPLMKEHGYGKGYEYPHDPSSKPMEYLPKQLVGTQFYTPPEGEAAL